MKVDFDLIVVGGGLVGCSFALDLATQNHKLSIAILENKPYISPDLSKLDNKIYAISPDNVQYLCNLGVWNDESKVGTIKTMDVSGDQNGNIILEGRSANQLFLAKTIEYNNLQHQLYTKLKSIENITFIYDQLSEINYIDDYAELIGEKSKYQSRLVVGADGANSFVRQQAKIDIEQFSYPEYGVVANFKCELPHKNIASQWFNNGEVLAYLPLPGNQISIVWSTKESKKLLESTNEELATLVANASGNKLGSLEVITKAVAFPLKLYMLKTVYSNKIVLIGDAAHTIHPLAGQGVNLGFGDAKLLAKELAKCQVYQLSDKAVLAKYNTIRIPQTRQMQYSCHFLYRLFGIDNFVISSIRNKGLSLINSLPFAKKLIMKKAVVY